MSIPRYKKGEKVRLTVEGTVTRDIGDRSTMLTLTYTLPTYRLSDLGVPAPRRLDRPCITVACSCCEYVFDEDEDGVVHFVDLAEAALCLPQYGWTQVDGAWQCETCTAGPCDLEADTHG